MTDRVHQQLVEAAKRQNERDAKLAEFLGQGDIRGLRLVGGSISHATFLEAARENMETFDMAPEKAVAEAAKEFKIMGAEVSSTTMSEVLEQLKAE